MNQENNMATENSYSHWQKYKTIQIKYFVGNFNSLYLEFGFLFSILFFKENINPRIWLEINNQDNKGSGYIQLGKGKNMGRKLEK